MLIGQLIAKLQHAAADCGGNLNVIVEGADDDGQGYVLRDVIIDNGQVDILLEPFDNVSGIVDPDNRDDLVEHDSNGTA